MIKLFKDFRRDLIILFTLSFIIIILLEGWSSVLQSKLQLKDAVLNVILKFAYSISAAIIFYFFAVHLREFKKRKLIQPLLDTYIAKLVRLKNEWLSEIYFVAVFKSKGKLDYPPNRTGGNIKNYYPSAEEIKLLAEHTPLHQTKPKVNMLDRIDHLRKEMKQVCDSILVLDINLKTVEVQLIGELRSCDLFTKVAELKAAHGAENIDNKNLNFVASELHSFLQLFKKIENNFKL